ncbi:MAG: hypothetical protein Q7T30_01115 [Planctomycetota bacterium]|nr:hypothetical protein [Planctomycetota bacterium]
MDDFLRWLAAWRGIEVEPGAAVQFEFAGFPTGGLGMLVLMGCALVILTIGFVYRRDGKNLTPMQRIVLGTLRTLAVLAAIALLLEPNLVTVKRETRQGHTILLIDGSQSMTHLDAWRRESVALQAQGWREIGVADPAGATRVDLVKALLGYQDGALVRKLAAKNDAQLYSFAGNIEQLPLLPPPPPELDADGKPLPPEPDAVVLPPRLDLAQLKADGRFSNLGGSLRTALDRSRNAEIAAVVFVTDGRRNAGPQGAEIARLLNQRKIPHTFVLGVGDPSETQTVALTRLEAAEKVLQKDPFEMKTALSSQGYDSMAVTVRLVRIDDKGQEQVVSTQQAQIGGDKTEVVVEWKGLTADAPGRFLYRAEIQPPDGEPPTPERHSKVVAVEVLGEKTRVLLISGTANHEYQNLRNLLVRDKTIDVSCWLQSADPKFPQDGDEEVRIDRLAEERQQFDPYDVVILIDPNHEKLTPNFCALLHQHVVEGGCGLWWVCGEKFTLDAMRPAAPTKALVDLLPVEPDIDYAERKTIGLVAFPRPWPFALSPEGDDGIAAKVSRIADGKDERRILWGRLPGSHFWFPAQRLKPAATCVAEHTNPEFRREGRGMPMIAMQNVGAGRVLYTGTDETYRWRSLYEDAYNRFWVNGIRYLWEGRIHAGNSRLRLAVNAEKVDLGDPIEITAEVKDEALQPFLADTFEVVLEREGQAGENVHLTPVEGVPGNYVLQLRPTQLGMFRVRPAQKIGKNVETGFQVVAALIEKQGPMDRAELAAIAATAGGQLFDTPAQLLAALDGIPSRSATDTFRTPHAIWDGWVTIAFLLVVLSLEWLLRKRFNLL